MADLADARDVRDLRDVQRRADASLDRGTGGTTELRVHGVSGTPPEAVLGHPLLRRVAGAADAGFYRRWYPGGRSMDLPDAPGNGASTGDLGGVAAGGRRLEAYSWGGLTSGSARRALWLLLLPFMLANVAHWMLPGTPPDASGAQRRAARVAVVVLRLFGLTLTFTMLLTAVLVAVDVAGWQCGQVDRCAASSGVLGLLSDGFLDTPGRRVAVTALVPLGVVLLLGLLGRRTPRTTTPAPVDAAPAATAVPLADRRFWAGNPGMAVLRTLHVAAATAVLAALVAWPATKLVATGLGRVVGLVVVVAALATLAAAAVLVAVEGVAGREADPSGRSGRSGPGGRLGAVASPEGAAALRRLALVLVAVALVLSAWGFGRPWDGAGRLPGLRGAVLLTFSVQLVLITILAAAVALQRPWRASSPLSEPQSRVSMAGMGAPVVATIAFLVAGGFSAGLTYRVAELLGHPVLSQRAAAADLAVTRAVADDPRVAFADRLAAATAETPLVVPPSFAWAGAAATVLVVALLVMAGLLALGVRRRLPGLVDAVVTEYAPEDDPPAARGVGRSVAVASLTDGAGRVLGGIVAVAGVVLVLGLVAYAPGSDDWRLVERPPLSTMTRFGTWVMGVFALGLVVLFWNAYRNPALRRTVGILWDVGSFWPRAAHPLAPPSYGERAVPELADRVTALTRAPDGRVVLSGHSQGSVLSAAAVLVLPPEAAARSALLTSGSPLRRLYARMFPVYLGPATLAAVGSAVGERWLNCYRDTDPIGSWVRAAATTPPSGVDLRLRDPAALGREVEGHSGYWTDPACVAAADELDAALRAPVEPPVPAPRHAPRSSSTPDPR